MPTELTPTDEVTHLPPMEYIELYDGTMVYPDTDLHDLPLDTRLTKHFTYREMVTSQTAVREGIDNTPSYGIFKAGVEFAKELLEPLRERFGPVYPSSWLRVHKLNVKIKGSKSSAHIPACALDHDTQEPLFDEMAWWIQSDLPFDQVIYEFGGWIHIGGAKPGYSPRRQALMAFKVKKVPWEIDPETGEHKLVTKYFPYDQSEINARGDGLK